MKNDRSTESGASLLRLMQSKSIKNLDLLIRESLQNSLDATKERKSKTVVKVDFKTGLYNSKDLTRELGDIGDRLDIRYPRAESNFIAIRDSNTMGLTGSNNPNDVRCNLQKLIYQISKSQEAKGSGGNWGLGKTTFFRLGIGVVLYYSRVFQDNKYECRLAASLVENEEDNPLVVKNGYRGIAYFGKYEKWPGAPADYTVPITDENDISRIIGIFGLTPYAGDETGTTVIIPYVNFDNLLSEMLPADYSDTGRKPVWLSDINSCIRLLIQRWYAPRLSNSDYGGSWLKASVNGEAITHEKMEPFFRIMQDLYNNAFGTGRKSEDLSEELFSRQIINIKDVIGRRCGSLSLAIVDSSMLSLTKEKYRNVYALIGDYDVPVGNPIVAYVRKPAMISRYETINSAWVPSFQNFDENKIIIGLFVLDSDKNITLGKNIESLEEYVRDGERSDHYGWHDDSVNTFVKRISENVKNKISAMLNQKVASDIEKRSMLSDVFTEMFLPPTFESDKGNVKETTVTNGPITKKGTKSKGSKSKNMIISNVLLDGKRTVVIQTKLGNKDDNVDYKFILSSENGSMSPKEWEESMKTNYPLHIDSFAITGYARPKGTMVPCNFSADTSKASTHNQDFTIDLNRSMQLVPYGANVTYKGGSTLECSIVVGSDIPSVSFEIRCMSRKCNE